jgi:hypothetical protein
LFADPYYVAMTPQTTGTFANAFNGAGSVSPAFVCIGRGPLQSAYRYEISSSNWIDLIVGRQEGKRLRATVRFTERDVVADPMNDNLNALRTMSTYIVVDVGPLGYSANLPKMLHALSSLCYDGSDGEPGVMRVVRGET